MHKCFIFLSLFFSFFLRNVGAQENAYLSLTRMEDVSVPTKQEIKAYEKEYGELPPQIKEFYQAYGDCYKEELEIFGLQGGKDSDLAKNTTLVRQCLPLIYLTQQYHAFAYDQIEGGWWVYDFQKTPTLTFELFKSGTHEFQRKKTYQNLEELLNK